MLALLVKPAALRKKSYRQVIDSLEMQGAHILQGHSQEEIHNEVSELLERDGDLTVVACGGDGTVHLLVNSVFGLSITFAVIPMGTGNDFARYLKLRNAASGVAALHGNQTKRIDVGTIHLQDGYSRNFVGIASCGFDAQVNERANRLRGPQGTLKYVAALLGELRALNSLQLEVTLDSEPPTTKDVVLLAIGNTSSYGGGMKVCPAADASDGEFDVVEVKRVSRSLLLRVFPRVFTGSHISHPKVESFTARKVRIAGDAFPIYADGERVGIGPATVSITPQALTVVVG